MTITKTNFVTHLESAIDGTHLPSGTIQTLHEGRPLWVRYDLDALAQSMSRDDLQSRPQSMWRYRELLPVVDDANIVSLDETMTPLMRCPRLGAKLGMKNLLIKDESRLPTGSFKARGMAMAISMAKELGITRVAAPTAGNAGGAMAAYAARAGMECYVFMPSDTPIVNRYEAALYGAKTYLIDGLINDCGRLVGEGKEAMGWFDLSTLKEPYRIEGKKTMGLELAEQMEWKLPDAILYPTGGGTGLIGMWKAFAELTALGWLEDPIKPRMYSCQSSGCAPISNAFEAGERFATAPDDPHTIASGLRVPVAVGDFMILDAVRASGGKALAAQEDTLIGWMNEACALEGIALCPESAACLGVLDHALKSGEIDPDETVVLFNTGAAQKYVEAMEVELPTLDHTKAIDWASIH
ncbi:MAG: threonine synthase [Planctomycetota bacterium]|nr:threonine synthase [Planctomycetota bacterium]